MSDFDNRTRETFFKSEHGKVKPSVYILMIMIFLYILTGLGFGFDIQSWSGEGKFFFILGELAGAIAFTAFRVEGDSDFKR